MNNYECFMIAILGATLMASITVIIYKILDNKNKEK